MQLGNLWTLPLQHHGTDLAPEDRHTMRVLRVQGTGRNSKRKPDLEDGSAADLLGGALWRVEPGARGDLHTQAFAWPGVTTEASKTPEVDPTKTTTREAATATRNVKARPVGDRSFREDNRYRELPVALPKQLGGIPKGWPMVVLPTTEEDTQTLVGFPAGGLPLVAVNNGETDPELATLVSDLTDDGEVDLERRARLHSAMRVVRPGTAGPIVRGSAKTPSLAWQLSTSGGADRLAGYGLMAGRVSGGAGPTVDSTADIDQGDDAGDPDSAPDSQYGAVTDVSNYMQQLLQNYKEAVQKEREKGGSSYGGVTNTGLDGFNAGSVILNNPPGDPFEDTPSTPPPASLTGMILAAAGFEAGGPLDVGDEGCQHRIGFTLDGEPINSAHLQTGALFRADSRRDAPLPFDAVPYSNPAPMPFRARAYLRHNRGKTHNHPTGIKSGLWEIESEAFFISTDTPPPPPPPPPDSWLDPRPWADPLQDPDKNPQPKPFNPAHNPSPYWETEDADGFRPISEGELFDRPPYLVERPKPKVPPRPPQQGDKPQDGRRAPCPAAGKPIEAPGIVGRADPWGDTALSDPLADAPVYGPPPPPDVGGPQFWAPNTTGLEGDWDYTSGPEAQGYPTANGGQAYMPGGMTLNDYLGAILAGDTPSSDNTFTDLYPTGLAETFWGDFSPADGACISGVRGRNDGAGGLIFEVVDSTGALVGIDMTIGEGGVDVDGDLDVSGKLTVGGMIDPPGIAFSESSSRPAAWPQPSAGVYLPGLYAGDTAGANEAWWVRDDGSEVDLSASGGSGALVQAKGSTTQSVVTCSGGWAYDNTIPQQTEGVQIFSVAITPTSTSNYLEFEFHGSGGLSTSGAAPSVALFQDSTANAVAVVHGSSGTTLGHCTFKWRMLAPSTSAITFKLRGASSSGNWHLNGTTAGGARYGGRLSATFTIKEVKP